MVNMAGMSQTTIPLSNKWIPYCLKQKKSMEVPKGSPKKTEPASLSGPCLRKPGLLSPLYHCFRGRGQHLGLPKEYILKSKGHLKVHPKANGISNQRVKQ